MNKASRIYFMDSPYPGGYWMKEFKWSGRIDENGQLWFDFHLVTEDYDVDDNHLSRSLAPLPSTSLIEKFHWTITQIIDLD